MKTNKKEFRSLLYLAFSITLIGMVSCSKNINSNLFDSIPLEEMGVYSGSLIYVSSVNAASKSIIAAEATIVDEGGSYSINYSDDIPALRGLMFESIDSSFISVSVQGSVLGVLIDNGKLTVSATTNNEAYTFEGNR